MYVANTSLSAALQILTNTIAGAAAWMKAFCVFGSLFQSKINNEEKKKNEQKKEDSQQCAKSIPLPRVPHGLPFTCLIFEQLMQMAQELICLWLLNMLNIELGMKTGA